MPNTVVSRDVELTLETRELRIQSVSRERYLETGVRLRRSDTKKQMSKSSSIVRFGQNTQSVRCLSIAKSRGLQGRNNLGLSVPNGSTERFVDVPRGRTLSSHHRLLQYEWMFVVFLLYMISCILYVFESEKESIYIHR